MTPLATHDYAPGDLAATDRFLRRTRWELRELRLVRAWPDRLQVIDVNKDAFEVRGLGYPDADVAPLLRLINAAFDPATVHEPTDAEYKEFPAGRRYAWAADRAD